METTSWVTRAGCTDGFYVFFERIGYATSPLGPLPDAECAQAVAVSLVIDGVVSARVELRSPDDSEVIQEFTAPKALVSRRGH